MPGRSNPHQPCAQRPDCTPGKPAAKFGPFRAAAGCANQKPNGYEQRFSPQGRTVQLYNAGRILREVHGLENSFSPDVILKATSLASAFTIVGRSHVPFLNRRAIQIPYYCESAGCFDG
jgi:hypothetical protein